MQFREIEFASGLKHESLLHEFRDDEFAQSRLQQRLAAPTLSDAFFAALQRRGLEFEAQAALTGLRAGITHTFHPVTTCN